VRNPEVHDHHAERLRHVGQDAKRQRRAEAGSRARELGPESGDRRRDRGGHHLLAVPLPNQQKPEPEQGDPPGKPREDVFHAARIPAWRQRESRQFAEFARRELPGRL